MIACLVMLAAQADEPPAWYELGLDREYPVVPEISADVVESVPGHSLAQCVEEEKELGERGTMLDLPDAFLFAAPRLTVRRIPDPSGDVPWHAHLILDDGTEVYATPNADSLILEEPRVAHIVIATSRVEARAAYFGDVETLLQMSDVPPSLRQAAQQAHENADAPRREIDGASYTHIADEVIVIPEYTVSIRILRDVADLPARLSQSPFATRLGAARLDGRDRDVWTFGLARNVNERTVTMLVPDLVGMEGEDMPVAEFAHTANPGQSLVPSFTVQGRGQALAVVPVPVELVHSRMGEAALQVQHAYFESALEIPVPPGLRPESTVERGFRRAVFWPASAAPARHWVVATRANTTRRVTERLEIPAGGGVQQTELEFDPAEEPSFTVVLSVRYVADPEQWWGPSSER